MKRKAILRRGGLVQNGFSHYVGLTFKHYFNARLTYLSENVLQAVTFFILLIFPISSNQILTRNVVNLLFCYR